MLHIIIFFVIMALFWGGAVLIAAVQQNNEDLAEINRLKKRIKEMTEIADRENISRNGAA